MSVDIELMRRNWRIVRLYWAEIDGWSAEDIDDARLAIRNDAGNPELVVCWANYLAELVAHIKSNPQTLDRLIAKGTPEKGTARVMRTSNDL